MFPVSTDSDISGKVAKSDEKTSGHNEIEVSMVTSSYEAKNSQENIKQNFYGRAMFNSLLVEHIQLPRKIEITDQGDRKKTAKPTKTPNPPSRGTTSQAKKEIVSELAKFYISDYSSNKILRFFIGPGNSLFT